MLEWLSLVVGVDCKPVAVAVEEDNKYAAAEGDSKLVVGVDIPVNLVVDRKLVVGLGL